MYMFKTPGTSLWHVDTDQRCDTIGHRHTRSSVCRAVNVRAMDTFVSVHGLDLRINGRKARNVCPNCSELVHAGQKLVSVCPEGLVN